MFASKGLGRSTHILGLGRRQNDICARYLSYSATPRPSTRTLALTNNGARPARSSRNAPALKSSLILPLVAGIRYQSTNPSTPPTTTIPSQPLPTGSSTKVDDIASTSSDNAFEVPLNSILEQPETIGYLKSLGLDYGWGPTSVMEWLLEHVHVFAGTPWWASIALTAVLIRALMFYPYISAADNAARLQIVNPITAPLIKKMTELAGKPDVPSSEVMAVRGEVSKIHKRAGIALWKSGIPLLQVFVGYGTLVLIRGMASLPVPGFETGGVLWFQNLAVPDPTYLLPLLTSGVMFFVMKKGGEVGGLTNITSPLMKFMTYTLPGVAFVATCWMPAGMTFSFFIGSLMSGGQAILFRNAAFRNFVGIVPLPEQAKDSSNSKVPSKDEPESPFQSRVVIAPKGTYRQTATYESPRPTGSKANIYGTNPTPKDEGLLGGLKQRMRDNLATAKKEFEATAKRGQEMVHGTTEEGRRMKLARKKAAAFETKRREEEKMAWMEENERRRQERLAKRQDK